MSSRAAAAAQSTCRAVRDANSSGLRARIDALSSQALAMRYDSGGARVHYHDSGHELPAALGADAPLQEAVAAFFQEAGREIRE